MEVVFQRSLVLQRTCENDLDGLDHHPTASVIAALYGTHEGCALRHVHAPALRLLGTSARTSGGQAASFFAFSGGTRGPKPDIHT